jgi:magnesium-transporting ATPase (P-type)
MVTSSPIALALGMEKADDEIMTVPPRSKSTTLFTKGLVIDMLVYGTIMGTLSLGSFIVTSIADAPWNESAYCYTHSVPEGMVAKGCKGIYAAR